MKDLKSKYKALQNYKIKDKHRPIYHFSPWNWMNDPIPFFFNGEYHIFFQHNPNGAFWGTMHWGHVVSNDLVRWTELPMALAPSSGGVDRDGCFTGCVVHEAAKFYIFYTGIPVLDTLQQTQCLAISDDLITWEKYPDNPLIAEKPDGYGECFRDPCIWKENNTWYMLIGGEKIDRKGGVAFMYKSNNLIHWEYMHPLFEGDEKRSGHDFECPDFFQLGEKFVLITSRDQSWWHIGSYQNKRFTMQQFGTVDDGALYAAKTFMDSKGRRILWGWIREERSEDKQKEAGWSGVLSLPRELTLQADRRIGFKPVDELKSLRGKYYHFDEFVLGADSKHRLDRVSGNALEIIIKMASSKAKRLGMIVRCPVDLSGGVEVFYDREQQSLITTPLDLKKDEELVMHIFIDRSVVEIFANEVACHTLRTYPDNDQCLSLGVFSIGGESLIKSIDVWELNSYEETKHE